MIFDAKMVGNAAPTIAGEISDVLFWPVIYGYADFSLGGGRFRKAHKSLKREHKVNRKLPATFEMLNLAQSEFWKSDAMSGARAGLFCAILLVFFSFFASAKWNIRRGETSSWAHI